MLNYVFSNPLYLRFREVLLCMIDMGMVFMSFLLAYWVRNDFLIPNLTNVNLGSLLLYILTIFVVYLVSFFAFKIHKSLWKYIGPVEVIRISASVGVSTLTLLAFNIIFHHSMRFSSVIFTAGILTVLLMLNVRLGYRLLRRKEIQDSANIKNAIIIGAGDGGYILSKELQQNKQYKQIKMIGFVDDKRVHKMVSGYEVLGDTYDLPQIAQQHKIQVAFIAIPSATKAELRRIADLCQSLKLETKIMKEGNDFFENGIPRNYPIEDISIEDLLGRGEIKLDQDEVRSYITNKIIAVTGAGGSIGSELCRQIIRFKPKQLIMIDINENALYMLEQEFNRNKVHGKMDSSIDVLSFIASIRDFSAIHQIFKEQKPDVVYHAAAHKHVPLMETRPQEAIKNNVFGTNNVINACIKNEVSRFIMISTDKAVNPTNVMGATKRMTEMILQVNGNNGVTKMAAVRFGNVLGSNGSVIPIFKKQIEEGGPVTITDKNIIRYFMTIPEAAQLVLQAGYYADKGEIFVLDMGEPVKILDLAEKMIRLSGYKPYEDIDIVEIGLRPGEKMFEELHLRGEITSKTKNDLIFVNHKMDINMEHMQECLNVLFHVISSDMSEETVKETIFHIINQDEIMNEEILV
ncbi:MAG: polysaccharide biosynthesis protein [Erysipelotrichaceae bacterium]|jgi:FlaA1/EpsC-like NDP-sugar epimerase|nr:polysaccharide biosynthesis protein [Erysipelotrichaceae bacterium]